MFYKTVTVAVDKSSTKRVSNFHISMHIDLLIVELLRYFERYNSTNNPFVSAESLLYFVLCCLLS